MALPAVRHLDPVIGVDVHSVVIAPEPSPVPLPHPHVGFVLDLREYVNAALGVIGSIVFTFVEERVVDYLEDHPDTAQQLADTLDHAAGALASAQRQLMSNALIAGGVALGEQAGAIADAAGAGVGMGSMMGRPIFVNGLLRTTAGTHTFHVPGLHFPLGEAFAPPDPKPSNDAESYMGSRTVIANNDPMSFMALPAMSCWTFGLEPPQHNGAHTKREHPSMPTSVMLPIPAGRPVLVGGPPIMNMAALAGGLFKALRGSKWARALADKLHLKSGFLRCKVLRAEPVDVTTGEVIVQHCDFTVPGRLPLEWSRQYASHDGYAGAVGVGWQTPADIRLEPTPHGDAMGAVARFPDHATAFDALPHREGWHGRVYDWQHGHALYRQADRLVLRTRAGIEYGFPCPARSTDALGHADWRCPLRVDRMADLSGNAWIFERERNGSVARICEGRRDATTQRMIECHSRNGRLTTMTLIGSDGGAHPLVSYEHDRAGNLSAAVDAMANPYRFEYDEGHRMVRHTSARGISFHYSYVRHADGVWRVDHAWGDDGVFDYRFAFDCERMETRMTDSLGHTSILQIDERGMPVAEINPLGEVTSYRYDQQGRTNAQVDPDGQATGWRYDMHGNLVMERLPDGSSVSIEFNADQRPVRLSVPGGRQWRYEWNEQGKLLAKITPAQAVSRYAYDGDGQLIAYAGPRGDITRFGYDRDGNLQFVTDALGNRTQCHYDARGNLVRIDDALGQTSRYEYDRNSNLTRAVEPGGREVHCGYDADGNLVWYRDAAGQVTQMAYSPLGQLRRRLTPDGHAVEYFYDSEERLTGVLNERGERYELKRDARGRIVEETDYWGQSRCYAYDAMGKLSSCSDPLGRRIDYGYDSLGRLVQRRVPDPTQDGGVRIDSFAYDESGNLVLAQNHASTLKFRYDADGRLVEEQQGDDFAIALSHDAAGNRIERRTRLAADGHVLEHVVRYTYDEANAVTSIQIDDAAPVVIERNALGQVRTEQLGARLRRELSHEASGVLATQTLLADAGALFASEYAHDANGELVGMRDASGAIERFQYDPVGRLTAHIDTGGGLRRFERDVCGALLKTRVVERRAMGVGDAGRSPGTWLREGEYDGCRYMFDCAGNLVRKQDGVHDLALRWDATGQLVEAMNARPASEEQPGIHDFDHIHAQYEYDAFQRRVRKIVHVRQGPDAVASDAGAAPLSRVCRFFWDGDVLAADYTVDHRVARSCRSESERTRAMPSFREAREWICYPGTFVPLAAVYCALPWPEHDERGGDRNHAEREANAARPVPPDEGVAARPLAGPGALYFYENAPNGAPMRMVDGDGNVVWGACYSALGGIVLREVCEIDQPIRLQGQYFDEESGISYNRHRYFDPHAGSFISQDPIGLAGGTDLYQFAPNPFRWADPRGLRLISVRAKLIVGNWTSGFYHSVPGEVHAEQGGLLENLNRVANHDIGFANIEGTVNRSDWFPVPICTERCRSELFWGAHVGGAASLMVPMVRGNAHQGNLRVDSRHFQYLAEEMERIAHAYPNRGQAAARSNRQWHAIRDCHLNNCTHP